MMKFLVVVILLFSLSFKNCHRNTQQPEATGVAKDSATIAREAEEAEETVLNNRIVATGKIAGYEFLGKSIKVSNIDMMLENGMEMLMNEQQYVELKLLGVKRGITLSVRIRDLTLLDKVPFSYTFTEGNKLIITVFIKNADGINEMYGGTIRNMSGRFTVTGINKNNKTMTGVLNAEVANILNAEDKCKIEDIHFTNATYFYSKKSSSSDTSMFTKGTDPTITQ